MVDIINEFYGTEDSFVAFMMWLRDNHPEVTVDAVYAFLRGDNRPFQVPSMDLLSAS
jgi:hypothetical protein